MEFTSDLDDHLVAFGALALLVWSSGLCQSFLKLMICNVLGPWDVLLLHHYYYHAYCFDVDLSELIVTLPRTMYGLYS